MKEFLHRVFSYTHYLVKAKTKYYLHSPFVYQFYLHVLGLKNTTENIDHLRQQLLNNTTQITFTDLGNNGTQRTRTVSTIVQHSSITPKYGNVLLNAVRYFQPSTVLELGTNLGISTCYLAQGNKESTVYTIEGSKALSSLAQKNTAAAGIKNVQFITGNFNEVLPEVLSSMNKVDFVFFDGNHKKTPTLQYFEQCLNFAHENTVFVFDDIYWSQEMSSAWNEIKAHPKVTLSIHIYRMGFVFFNKQKLAKEHFSLLF
ncbi:MAG: class I SAM-dependent methyltransferase [Chitinophagales bacterium]